MRVVLHKEVKGVGKPGDVKDVADGYATNFLLPRGLAVRASTATMRAVAQQQESAKTRSERERAEMRELARRIGEARLSFALKAGAQGKLFGSVTNRDIADALSTRGIAIERSKIHLAEPIRSVGTHRVDVRLLPDVHAEITIEVTAA
ncbi:MAG: 50S ribosomal protein L9 [Chloroflexi bacterium 13_1_40CM_4_68_4]|nr:MAG: 50S ribosomal protein L9 [Chloroflexi bacterium 13_1_40CM_4_68_4]